MKYYIIVVLISVATGQVPLSEFYQYGNPSGDSSLASQDDASTQIPIQFDYPFFGSVYREVHVTTNGLLMFGAGSSGFIPIPFPLTGMKSIATYWTDSDPSRGGTVFYRETHDPSLLDRISQEIRMRLVQYRSFSSQWALIVTFDRVSAYGCFTSTSTGTCSSNCSKVVTNQAVLTSNGINSFVIFNFNKLEYTVGTAGCTGHAQIGFNAGDGRRFYLVPSSNTPNIATVGLLESNVGVPGKWIFATDGDDISGGCNVIGQLEVLPRRVLYFSDEYVTILGPCFNNNDFVISVLFGSTPVVCQIENVTHANCQVPLLDKLGRNSVSLTHNSIIYESFIIVVEADDSKVKESSYEVQNTDETLSQFTITWNNELYSDVSNDIFFNGYQRNYYIDDNGAVIFQNIAALNYGAHLNTGRATFTPLNSPSPPELRFEAIFREIAVGGIQQGNRVIAKMIFQIENSARSLVSKHCLNWYSQQPSEREMRDIVNEVSSRSPCPPAAQRNFPQAMGNFQLDSSCNPSDSGKKGCQYFHAGAKGCYRSINNGGRPAAQCCYGDDNSLLLGPPGGGTLDFKDSSVSVFNHFLADVLPYITCCKYGTGMCNKYYEKRPSIDSRNFRPPGSGNGNGDPHFRTLDGTSYTFNPVGEFIYLTTAGAAELIQVRISQYHDVGGIPKQACYLSGFAVKTLDSDTVQVELNALNMFTFRINGQSLALENGVWNFNGISLNYQDNSTVVLHTTSGIDLEIQILSGMLHVIYTLPETLKEKISGLIGDWDGISTNDLKLPNGTWIPVQSSNEDIHYKFGMAWSTTNQTSIFTYPTGLTWFDYQNANFRPEFSAPAAVDECAGDISCNYDVRATGNLNAGLSNIIIRNQTDDRNKQNKEISQVCPTQVTVVNGKVKVDRYSASVTTYYYTVECNSGFDLIGSGSVTCVDGAFQPLGVCQAKSSNSSRHNTFIPITIILAFVVMWDIGKPM